MTFSSGSDQTRSRSTVRPVAQLDAGVAPRKREAGRENRDEPGVERVFVATASEPPVAAVALDQRPQASGAALTLVALEHAPQLVEREALAAGALEGASQLVELEHRCEVEECSR
jgi:hypothetical protein